MTVKKFLALVVLASVLTACGVESRGTEDMRRDLCEQGRAATESCNP
jgi:outer membrane lipopolysaccharide assembly protein LptE/RlpB